MLRVLETLCRKNRKPRIFFQRIELIACLRIMDLTVEMNGATLTQDSCSSIKL
jgi:hypothetical protein